MSLFGLMNAGATGLHANGVAMSVTSQNVQNSGTDGYTRRDVRFSPVAPPLEGGGGVRMRGSRRIMDQLLERRMLGATSARAEASSREQALSVLDRVLGEVEGGLGSSMDDFEVALAELVGRPGEPATREAVLASVGRLAASFNGASRTLEAARDDVDSQIELEVDGINTSLRAIADLGVAIQRAEIDGKEASDLRDQRDQWVRELADKLPITTVEDDKGGMNVLLGGGIALVSAEGEAAELTTAPDPTTGDMTIQRKLAGLDTDVTGLVESGSLGGMVAARDGAIADAMSALDQLAFDVAGAYNAAHSAGFGMDGVGGRDIFATTATATGAAAALQVSADVAGQPENLAAATDPALGAGDNRNALALSALADADIALGGTATAQEGLGSMIGAAGNAIRSASLDASFTDNAAAQLEAMRASISGVSVDEEMIALERYQRGYQASLRVVQAADSMLQELMNLAR